MRNFISTFSNGVTFPSNSHAITLRNRAFICDYHLRKKNQNLKTNIVIQKSYQKSIFELIMTIFELY